MKISFHMGSGKDGSAIHNCRQYNISASPHVNPDRLEDNIYWSCFESSDPSFHQDFVKTEKIYYKKNFKSFLDRRNDLCRKYNHQERIMTMDQFRKSPRYRPQEFIIQVGNIHETIDKESFSAIAVDMVLYNEEITKKNSKVLDFAIHNDESTPHAHIRSVWQYKDETNTLCIGKEKALEQAGIPLPNPTKPVSKYNNRTMTYTKMMNEHLYDLCLQYQIDVEKPKKKGLKKHIRKDEYVYKQMEELRENQKIQYGKVPESRGEISL